MVNRTGQSHVLGPPLAVAFQNRRIQGVPMFPLLLVVTVVRHQVLPMAKVRLHIFSDTQILKTFIDLLATSLDLMFFHFHRCDLFRILSRVPNPILREILQAWFIEPISIGTIFYFSNPCEPFGSFFDLMKVRVRAKVPFFHKAIQIMLIDQTITSFLRRATP